jgi:perosamine synthetase
MGIMVRQVPIARPVLEEDERARVSEVLYSGMLSKGPKGEALETGWAEYCGTKHAVAVNNGTAALIASLACLGVGPGDEVVTVSFTFNATVAAVLAVGATPVFVDVDRQTFLMDLNRLAEAVTEKTAVVLPVHLFGLMVDPIGLYRACGVQGFFPAILEDASQAHGADVSGVRAGAIGDAAAFSLYATKNMTAGEGGLITTSSPDLHYRLQAYRSHGARQAYLHESLGYNYRLPEVSAAIALGQMLRLGAMNDERRRHATTYDVELANLEGVTTPFVPEGRRHVYHQYVIKVRPECRDAIRTKMAERGVSTGVHYGLPVHRQPYYLRLRETRRWPGLANTDLLAPQVISLPIYPGLTESEQNQVIDALKAAVA